jgi:hypothetical protein
MSEALDEPVAYISVQVRFFHSILTPIQRREAVARLLSQHCPGEEIEVEIGEHTGTCRPDYCDQSEGGWHP